MDLSTDRAFESDYSVEIVVKIQPDDAEVVAERRVEPAPGDSGAGGKG